MKMWGEKRTPAGSDNINKHGLWILCMEGHDYFKGQMGTWGYELRRATPQISDGRKEEPWCRNCNGIRKGCCLRYQLELRIPKLKNEKGINTMSGESIAPYQLTG
jgi:hypothetical protein